MSIKTLETALNADQSTLNAMQQGLKNQEDKIRRIKYLIRAKQILSDPICGNANNYDFLKDIELNASNEGFRNFYSLMLLKRIAKRGDLLSSAILESLGSEKPHFWEEAITDMEIGIDESLVKGLLSRRMTQENYEKYLRGELPFGKKCDFGNAYPKRKDVTLTLPPEIYKTVDRQLTLIKDEQPDKLY